MDTEYNLTYHILKILYFKPRSEMILDIIHRIV